MIAKPKTSMLKKSIALAALWIFLFSNVSSALRPQSANDRLPHSRIFYDLTPGNSDEPFWHLVQRACAPLKNDADKKKMQILLSKVSLDSLNEFLAQTNTSQIAVMEKENGGQVGQETAEELVRHAAGIGELQSGASQVSNEVFWPYVENSLDVNIHEMHRMLDDCHAEMDRGLGDEEPSSLAMIPTYVGPPQGFESGTFLGIDVGGTNVRWLKVWLEPGRPVMVVSDGGEKMPDEVIHGGTAAQLFGFISERGKKFLASQGLSSGTALHTGFTWSYPVVMLAVNKGRHMKWVKEIQVSGVVDQDPVELLRESLRQAGVPEVLIDAICNDTVGTYMARAIIDRSCIIGIILGTGSNATYPERIDRIRKWRGIHRPSNSVLGGTMLINMEWGNFGGRKLLRNKPVDQQEKTIRMDPFDVQLDIASDNPGDHPFEKQISGLYLGECVRLRCAEAIRRGLLFGGATCPVFRDKNGFHSDSLDPIINDNTIYLARIEALLKRWGIQNSTIEDRHHLQRLCALVVKRAARKSAAATVAVATRVDPELREPHTAAIDGSVYQHIHSFRVEMNKAYKELLGAAKGANLRSVLTKDGSGIGAAVTAAVVSAEYFTDGVQVDGREWKIMPNTDETQMRNIKDSTLYARRTINGLWARETWPEPPFYHSYDGPEIIAPQPFSAPASPAALLASV